VEIDRLPLEELHAWLAYDRIRRKREKKKRG